MLLTAAPLFFAVIADAATPFFPNATTSSTSSTSLGNDPTITPSAYYNPAAFVNPYFFILINTSGDLVWSSLRSCGSIWASSFTRWLGTAEVSTGPIIPATTQTTTWLPWISTSTGSMETVVTTILPKTFTSTVPAQGPLYYVPDYLDFTASEPCCYSCTLYGGNVQVYYWPEKTQSPPISTLVNSAGFTFVSPSIYVAFESLHASDLCGDVGPQYTATTLSFSPGELSTSAGLIVLSSYAWNVLLDSKAHVTWTEATFGDQTDCGDIVNTAWNFGGMGFTDLVAASSAVSSMLIDFPIPGTQISDLLTAHEFTYDPCKPTLSIPSQVLTINSQWSSCAPPVTAFYDPPYALSQGNGLVAFAPSTSSAAPGPTAEPDIASATFTTSPTPASSSSTPVVPSSSRVIELQPIQIVSIADSSALSPSEGSPDKVLTIEKGDKQASTSVDLTIDRAASLSTNLPADTASDAIGNNPEATEFVAIDPSWTDSSQNPAGQSSVTASSPPAAILTFGSSTITADKSSNFVLASQTLTPGGEVTVSGTHLSLASDGGYAVLDGTTTQMLATAVQASPPVAVLSFGSSAITADESSNFVLASQTLAPGGELTISGTHVSLASDGGYVVLDGTTTQMLATATQASSHFSLMSGSYSADLVPTVEYIVSSQTLRPNGPAITVGGTVISFLPGASNVLVGTSTVALSDLIGVTTTSLANIGGIIATIGGFATDSDPAAATQSATGTGSGNYNGTMFFGGAAKTNGQRSVWILGLVLGLGVLGVCWL